MSMKTLKMDVLGRFVITQSWKLEIKYWITREKRECRISFLSNYIDLFLVFPRFHYKEVSIKTWKITFLLQIIYVEGGTGATASLHNVFDKSVPAWLVKISVLFSGFRLQASAVTLSLVNDFKLVLSYPNNTLTLFT